MVKYIFLLIFFAFLCYGCNAKSTSSEIKNNPDTCSINKDAFHEEHTDIDKPPKQLNMTSWYPDCDKFYYLGIDVAGVQFQFPEFAMNTRAKWASNTECDLYFSFPIIRPIPENMEDCKDYSEEIPIGKLKLTDNNKLEFTWYGFYNTKTRKNVHTSNPYGGSENYTILKKCRE